MLPAYAPELNPDEGVWKHLKYVELKNVACQTLNHLHGELRRVTMRLRRKQHVICGCIRHTGLY